MANVQEYESYIQSALHQLTRDFVNRAYIGYNNPNAGKLDTSGLKPETQQLLNRDRLIFLYESLQAHEIKAGLPQSTTVESGLFMEAARQAGLRPKTLDYEYDRFLRERIGSITLLATEWVERFGIKFDLINEKLTRVATAAQFATSMNILLGVPLPNARVKQFTVLGSQSSRKPRDIGSARKVLGSTPTTESPTLDELVFERVVFIIANYTERDNQPHRLWQEFNNKVIEPSCKRIQELLHWLYQ